MNLQYVNTQIVQDSILICEIQHEGSLLEQKGQLFLQELKQINNNIISGELSGISAVLLFQKNPAYDFSYSWLSELQNDLLKEDLFNRVIFLQDVLCNIKQSTIPWIYVSANDCYGFYIELALSCHLRLWLNPKARIGFNALKAEVLPCANIFIPIVQKDILHAKTSFSWHEYYPKNIEESVLQHYWNIFYVNEAIEKIVQFIKELLTKHQTIVPQKDNFTNLSLDAPPVVFPKYDDIKFFYDQKIFLKYNLTHNSSLLELAFKIFISQKVLEIPFAPKYLLAWLGTQNILSKDYIKFLQKENFLNTYYITHQKILNKISKKITTDKKECCFNISSYFPPVCVIENLLKNNIKCIFVATDPDDIIDSLEFLHIKLSKKLPRHVLNLLWNDLVFHFLGDKEQIKADLLLSFFYEDTVYIYHKDKEEPFVFLRLDGNLWDATLGWYEYPVRNFKEGEDIFNSSVFELLNYISEGIIITKWAVENKLHLSTLIRSLFLDELVKFCLRYSQEFFEILDCLKETGWRNVSEFVFWEKFLDIKQYPFSVSVTDIDMNVSPLQLNKDVWEFVQMKEVLIYIQSNIKKKKENIKSQDIHKHFCLYLYAIVHLILKNKLVKNIDDANLITIKALGFPETEGTPEIFVQHFGKTRAHFYIKELWGLEINSSLDNEVQ